MRLCLYACMDGATDCWRYRRSPWGPLVRLLQTLVDGASAGPGAGASAAAALVDAHVALLDRLPASVAGAVGAAVAVSASSLASTLRDHGAPDLVRLAPFAAMPM
jgi:hypothetical protein